MPWCRFFVAKMASPDIKPGDPNLNEHIMYAKCVKGHVLRDANDWILCENLPAPDSLCWKEGGETLFSLMKKESNAQKTQEQSSQQQVKNATR